jgi:hypothetical protein
VAGGLASHLNQMQCLFRPLRESAILPCFAALWCRMTTEKRKGGRVVECAGLEIQCTFRRTVSSNLTLSAK